MLETAGDSHATVRVKELRYAVQHPPCTSAPPGISTSCCRHRWGAVELAKLTGVRERAWSGVGDDRRGRVGGRAGRRLPRMPGLRRIVATVGVWARSRGADAPRQPAGASATAFCRGCQRSGASVLATSTPTAASTGVAFSGLTGVSIQGGAITSTAGKYVLIRAGSRVSSASPAASACAPTKKSGSGAARVPPPRR